MIRESFTTIQLFDTPSQLFVSLAQEVVVDDSFVTLERQ